MHSRVISVNLGNNEIFCTHSELLHALLLDHQSLTHINLSNSSESKKHKNKLGNEGFESIIMGI
jgi:hypothetical protein